MALNHLIWSYIPWTMVDGETRAKGGQEEEGDEVRVCGGDIKRLYSSRETGHADNTKEGSYK